MLRTVPRLFPALALVVAAAVACPGRSREEQSPSRPSPRGQREATGRSPGEGEGDELAPARALPSPRAEDREQRRPPAAQGARSYGYAESPITALADSLTDLAMAAVRGEALPQTELALRQGEPGQPLVALAPGTPQPVGLSVVGLGMDLETALPAASGEGGGMLRTGVFLCASGLRLADLDVREPREAWTLPPAFAGVEQVAATVLEALRAGRVETLVFAERDRSVIGHDGLFDLMLEGGPEAGEMQAATAMARWQTAPSGYWIDGVALLARDEGGRLYALRMQFQQAPGSLTIETDPLVSVRRLIVPDTTRSRSTR